MSDLGDLDRKRMPQHVAIIMDGNGRWAKERGLPRTEGHVQGEKVLFDISQACLAAGVEWLTVYAFSTENWNRPPSEVKFLLNFNRSILNARRDRMREMGVRIRFMGRRDWRLPKRLVTEIEEAERATRHNRDLTLTVAFNYGGRAEVVDAVKKLLAQHDAGKIRGRITEDSIQSRLQYPDMPDPDLVIRTSGEQRTSNFLMWQAAYAEWWFTDALWPDFDRPQFYDAIRDFQRRDRRFGAVPQ